MDAPLPLNPVSPGWMAFCGIVVGGAALKEVARRIADSPLAVAPKRPSLVGSMVVGMLLKHAVARIGRSAMGLPAGR
jgi:hypothetical protein